MAQDDWFRRTKWTRKNESEFLDRLKKSRGAFKKAQYLRIQALYLEKKHPETALRLLGMMIEDYPEPTQLAPAYLQTAHCLIALKREEEAIPSFRKVLKEEAANPSVLTQGYLDYPMFIVTSGRHDLFTEADGILRKHQERPAFPLEHYRWNTAMALLSRFHNDSGSACEFAKTALRAAEKEHSGFRYHPQVGLVKKKDRKIQKQLRELAR